MTTKIKQVIDMDETFLFLENEDEINSKVTLVDISTRERKELVLNDFDDEYLEQIVIGINHYLQAKKGNDEEDFEMIEMGLTKTQEQMLIDLHKIVYDVETYEFVNRDKIVECAFRFICYHNDYKETSYMTFAGGVTSIYSSYHLADIDKDELKSMCEHLFGQEFKKIVGSK